MPEARRYQPVEIAAQFARSLERELDFATEARNIERFAQELRRRPAHRHPAASIREWTSEALNCAGARRRHRRRPIRRRWTRAGLDRKLLAARGAEAFLQDDPRSTASSTPTRIPGNVFYLPGNRIVMIDFGMVGRLSPHAAQRR